MSGPLMDNQSNGYWKYYFESGNLKMEGNLINNKKDEQWIYYHENGKVKSIGDYKSDVKNGVWVYNNENGDFKAQGEYDNGKGIYYEFYDNGKLKMNGPIENEKSNGHWSYYNKKGVLESEGIEKNGLKQGYWKFYYPNGKLKSEGSFNNGKASGDWRYFYENGIIKAEGKKKEDYKTGYWKVMFETGAIQSEANYNETETGEYTEFYPSGKLKISGQYKDGKHNGLWKYYYDDGSLEGNCNYNQGIGYYKGFTNAGKLKIEGRLNGTEKIGTWTMYDQNENIAGYYHTYDNEKQPVFSATVERKKTLPSGHLIKPKNQGWKNFKNSDFAKAFASSKPGLDGIIISNDPTSILFGKFGLSAEYWVRKKFGHELLFHRLSNPFINLFEDQNLNINGNSFGYRFKIYNESIFSGFVHFDNELRFSNTVCNAVAKDSLGYDLDLKRVDNVFEYSFLFGHRFILSKSKHIGSYKGWTADSYFGLGLGVRNISESWDNEPEYNTIFKSKSNNPISIPIRFGFNIGYSF